jgi:hypothetical protein
MGKCSRFINAVLLKRFHNLLACRAILASLIIIPLFVKGVASRQNVGMTGYFPL